MIDDPENSLGDAATSAGRVMPARPSSDASLGDERTIGDGGLATDGGMLGGIEIVDLAERYAIEGSLGEGGMGAVVLATDTRLGRKLAIKRILGEAARSKAALARFLTEARAIAAISHPNVVQIYELGVAKDGPFLVIEYIDGGSLLDRCSLTTSWEPSKHGQPIGPHLFLGDDCRLREGPHRRPPVDLARVWRRARRPRKASRWNEPLLPESSVGFGNPHLYRWCPPLADDCRSREFERRVVAQRTTRAATTI